MFAEDWPAVASIYQNGIATGIATFETKVPTYQNWSEAHLQECRLVAIYNKVVVGWAALSAVSKRPVYAGVAEVSIYLNNDYHRKGFGSKLLQALVLSSESEGFWALQSGIFPENQASIALHKKAGFRYLGKRERIAKNHQGEWTDNLLFERRSPNIN